MDEKQKVESPIKGIVKGLLDFQSACPAITKEKKAGGGKFSYKYGSLSHIIETIRPHLKKANLVFTQPISYREGATYIYTTIYHVTSGEKIESKMILPVVSFQGMNEIQSGGAVITYVRRYALMSILGLVTEDDDTDAVGKTEHKSSTEDRTSSNGAENTKQERKWLNPENQGKQTVEWFKATKYLSEGGTIEDIKVKYRISKKNEEKLLNDAMTFDDLPESFDKPDEILGADGDPVNQNFDKQKPSGAEFSSRAPGDNPQNY